MRDLILGLIVFVVAFLGRYLFYVLHNKKKKRKKDGISLEMLYLSNKFKLDIKKLDNKNIAFVISLMDAFIISTSLIISVTITDNVMLELLIGLVLVIGLIYGINEIFGRILVERGYRK